MADGIDFNDAERMLLEAEFTEVKSLWSSSNYVFLAQMCGGDGEAFTAIYKPLRGESPLWDFPEGSLYRREAGAYRLSRLLDWPFIPPTVVRDGPHGVGSLQVFVPHDSRRSFFEQREEKPLVPQLKRMAVFDYVANNADRKGGHCLLDSGGRIWGIDHGLCFHSQYKLRTVIWDWADQPIRKSWLKDVERAAHAVEAALPEAAGLLEMISADEAGALIGRAESLLRTGVFPRPGPHRSYPWPLV